MWIESHQSLRDHPKKDELSELLFNGTVPVDVADYATIGLLHQLWWWALDYAPDGDLSPYSPRQIAKACRWHGDPATLLQSLLTSGFITKDGRLNDWYDYAGKLLERRAKNKERMCNARAQHVRNTCEATVPTVPIKRGRVIHSSAKAPVDNCPKCLAEQIEKPLEPDGHCALCGYKKRAK